MSGSSIARDPFERTGDPEAYVPRPLTEEIIASVLSFLRVGAHMIGLRGPEGMGKTLLMRVIAARLEARMQVVHVEDPALPAEEISSQILDLMREPVQASPDRALVARARELRQNGSGLALLVDDAGSSPLPTLRRLARLAGEARPALRLVLALPSDERADEIIAAIGPGVEMVEFDEPMTEEETRAYLASYLARADAPEWLRCAFERDAAEAIAREADGLPAEVNRLAGEWWQRLGARERWARDAEASGSSPLRADPEPAPEAADRPADAEDTAAVPTPASAALASGSDAAEPGAGPLLQRGGASAAEPEARDAESTAAGTPTAAEPDGRPARAPSAAVPEFPGWTTPTRRGGLGIATRAAAAAAALVLAFLAGRMTAPRPAAAPDSRPSPVAAAAAPSAVAGEGADSAERADAIAGEVESALAASAAAPEIAAAESVAQVAPETLEDTATALEDADLPTVASGPPFGVGEAGAAEPPSAPADNGGPTEVRRGSDVGAAEVLAANGGAAAVEPIDVTAHGASPIPVSINAVPWAEIEVDGESIGVTPLADVPISAGRHEFRARYPDGRVEVRFEEVTTLNRRILFR